MKHVGILTHFYKTHNYGGSLQSYALCEFLRELGADAEQISYVMNSSRPPAKKITIGKAKKAFHPVKLCRYLLLRAGSFFFRKGIAQRKKAVEHFNNTKSRHSEQVYTADILNTCTYYDTYIVGSDQVWNPDWYEMAFFLDFVPEGKRKFSYAASLGKKQLTTEQQEVFREKLADFAAVSVREQDAIGLLQELSPVPVVQTLDPTLLLTREQWDEVSSERLIPKKYIFTYFLGADINQRKVATAFAKKKGLPIVTLPFLEGSFRTSDVFFGDKKLYDVSPADFISLIKHAEYVLTDSFHACVFSSIYQKEHFAFQRLGHAGMGGRLYSLTKLFHSEDHFCDSPEKTSLRYIENLTPIDYSQPVPEFLEMLEFSKKFLFENLE